MILSLYYESNADDKINNWLTYTSVVQAGEVTSLVLKKEILDL